MEDIKSAVLAGCMLGIAFAVIKNMIPDVKIYKTLRMLMALVLTVTIILPFINGEIEITMPASVQMPDDNNQTLSSQLDEMYIEEIEKEISKNLGLYLKRDNISVKKLVIETYVDEYNFLEVNKVSVTTEEKNNQKALEVIREHLGERVIVEFYDEE